MNKEIRNYGYCDFKILKSIIQFEDLFITLELYTIINYSGRSNSEMSHHFILRAIVPAWTLKYVVTS